MKKTDGGQIYGSRNHRGASLWPGVDEQHARRMQAAFENKPERVPRSHRISRVVAGGLFALFFGALIQALTVFGVITMNSGHVFMVIAFVAGVLMITTEILPLKPTRHKVGAIVILAVVLGLIDLAAALYANKRASPAPQVDVTQPAAIPSQPTPEGNDVEGNVFLSEKYPTIGSTKNFTFFGIKNYGSVSIKARFGLSSNFTIILLVHSTEPEPGIAAGDCLTAINNYQSIVDDLKVEAKKRSPEFIDFAIQPNLVCHYDYATDIAPATSEALKRIALLNHLVLSIEGPRGPK